ncbi:hypothetical protein [Leptobacterium sp. I13]|uniref:hypothetical protein n=1 Tax=Leptobacterium meishanense TaxID=3128904 RepID=UPI0030EBB452
MKQERLNIYFLILFFGFLMVPQLINAQCAMCRAVLESGEEQQIGEGINNGIIYLMAIPYILIGALGFLIYKKLKK